MPIMLLLVTYFYSPKWFLQTANPCSICYAVTFNVESVTIHLENFIFLSHEVLDAVLWFCWLIVVFIRNWKLQFYFNFSKFKSNMDNLQRNTLELNKQKHCTTTKWRPCHAVSCSHILFFFIFGNNNNC